MGKIIGIIGGMGPLATVDIFEKIVKMTPAATDQEHHRMMIYNNPKIPSRMEAGLGHGVSPLAELIDTARRLERAGADFLIMPCHTAHIWLNQIRREVRIPIISIVETTVSAIEQEHDPRLGQILLLSSQATIRHGLYQEAFQERNMSIQLPTVEDQQFIEVVIQQVKASAIDHALINKLNSRLQFYFARGTRALLGGCTEIPLLFPLLQVQMKKWDPTLMLAQRAIELAKEKDGGEAS
ncbi:hypothetical protein BEP19_09420 [Ammoniphilus oxalaticus]|uniref:Aspartate racemase n=1 Tax=Ammoniphilus oxalaticus TaxID=66863 RepID=A0A419SKX7_9BACL|nr:amino acid racemase [Ammoniphilus oxalaticus]RKD24586.1 hypothetical protein BEP19_09420 [Ammoniphilus oxalaticus]